METKESDWQKKKKRKDLTLQRNRGCLTHCYVLLNLEPKCRYEMLVQKSKNNPLIGRTKGQTESAPMDGGKTVNTKKALKSRFWQAGCLRTRTLRLLSRGLLLPCVIIFLNIISGLKAWILCHVTD